MEIGWHLGQILSSKVIEVDPKKMEAAKICPRPSTPSYIQSLLSLTGQYRRFVNCTLSIASPLKALIQKNAKLNCSETSKS